MSEALSLLHWKRSLRGTVSLRLDTSLPIGSARSKHYGSHHVIRVHPRSESSLWHSLRHELLHVFLKQKIHGRIALIKVRPPVSADYRSQSVRDNVEEYVVRVLNARFLSQSLGRVWLKKQLAHDRRRGFRRIVQVADRVGRWQKSHALFSSDTFVSLSWLFSETHQ